MKRLSLVLLASTTLLAGCSVPLSTLTGAPGAKTSTACKAGSTCATTPVAIGSLEFKAMTAANAKFLSSQGNVIAAGAGNLSASTTGSNAASAPSAAAPMTATASGAATPGAVGPASPVDAKALPAPAPIQAGGAGGATSGNVYGYYDYGYYFGGFGLGSGDGTPMALISLSQAEASGSKGTFQDVLKNVVAPVVKAWANDARLIQTSATLNDGGTPFLDASASSGANSQMKPIGINPYGQDAGYRFVYASPSRSEVLNFNVAPDKTVVLRLAYAPLDLSPELVTVDSSSAIQKLIGAIKDRNFQSQEEKTGNDYFLGFPFTQPDNGGIYNSPYGRTDVVYDVPADARWNVNLQQIMGKLVWSLDYSRYQSYGGPIMAMGGSGGGVMMGVSSPGVVSAGASTAVAAQATTAVALPAKGAPPVSSGTVGSIATNVSFNDNARGMVDATNGTVIRFTRPTKYTYGQPIAYPIDQPAPAIAPAATVSGTAQPVGPQ